MQFCLHRRMIISSFGMDTYERPGIKYCDAHKRIVQMLMNKGWFFQLSLCSPEKRIICSGGMPTRFLPSISRRIVMHCNQRKEKSLKNV